MRWHLLFLTLLRVGHSLVWRTVVLQCLCLFLTVIKFVISDVIWCLEFPLYNTTNGATVITLCTLHKCVHQRLLVLINNTHKSIAQTLFVFVLILSSSSMNFVFHYLTLPIHSTHCLVFHIAPEQWILASVSSSRRQGKDRFLNPQVAYSNLT